MNSLIYIVLVFRLVGLSVADKSDDEKYLNICQSVRSICLNGGVCSSVIGSKQYRCNCTATNFTGPNCQYPLDPCAQSTPCQNNGTCTTVAATYINICGAPVYNYTCACASGLIGPQCQYVTSPCGSATGRVGSGSSSPCRANATCTALSDNTIVPTTNWLGQTEQSLQLGNFTCTCPVGFIGPNCQYPVNPCNSGRGGPCQNNGVCTRLSDNAVDANNTLIPGNFTCACPATAIGLFCEFPLSPCVKEWKRWGYWSGNYGNWRSGEDWIKKGPCDNSAPCTVVTNNAVTYNSTVPPPKPTFVLGTFKCDCSKVKCKIGYALNSKCTCVKSG